MAATIQDSRVSAGKKLKRSLKKKRKMKLVAKAEISNQEDELKDSSDGEGNTGGALAAEKVGLNSPRQGLHFFALCVWD